MKRSNGSQPPASAMAWSISRRSRGPGAADTLEASSSFSRSLAHAGIVGTVPPPRCQPPSRPVVLVTGAARRLGREIALDLARHGFDVAVHYRASAADADATVADARAFGAQAQAFRADLSDEAACRALRARGRRLARPARRRGQQRLDLRVRRCGELQLRRDGRALARQHGAGDRARAGAARTAAHRAGRRGRRAASAASSTCSTRSCGTRTPTISRTPCRRRRSRRPRRCSRRRSRRGCGSAAWRRA